MLLMASRSVAQEYTFTDLGTLGGTDSYANEINNRGEIVGTARTPGNQFSSAFVYRNGTMSNLGASADSDTFGRGINNTGAIVGIINNIKGATEGFMIVSGVQTSLGGFEPEAINDSLVIAGRYTPPAPQGNGWGQAGQSYNGFLTQLGLLPGTYRSFAYGINNIGQSVGFCYFPGDALTYAFRYASQMVDIGTLSGGYTRALAINDRGDVVGASQIRESNANGTRVSHGFLFRNGAMSDLGTLGNPLTSFAEAKAINNRGIVVGWSDNRAVIFRGGRARDLNVLAAKPKGYTLIDAVDINDLGQIVGNTTTPNGTIRAFLLTPDKRRPSITVDGPKVRSASGRGAIVTGRAKDNLSVDRVEFQIGNGPFRKAAGTKRWRVTTPLRGARTRLRLRAVDDAENRSRPSLVAIARR